MEEPVSPLQRVRRHVFDVAMAVGFVIVGVVIILDMRGYKEGIGREPGPAALPGLLCLILFILAVGMIVQVLRGKWDGDDDLEADRTSKTWGGFALLILCGLLMPLIGFFVTFSLALFGMSMLVELKSWWRALLFSVVLTWIVMIVFGRYLNVPLPAGPVDLFLGA